MTLTPVFTGSTLKNLLITFHSCISQLKTTFVLFVRVVTYVCCHYLPMFKHINIFISLKIRSLTITNMIYEPSPILLTDNYLTFINQLLKRIIGTYYYLSKAPNPRPRKIYRCVKEPFIRLYT